MIDRTGTGIEIRISEAIPPGEIWLAAGCSGEASRPDLTHCGPEWRVVGMCVHEHLEKLLLCAGCKGVIEGWQKTHIEPPGPWCALCYRMRPGGHCCTVAVEFRPLD